MHSLIKNKIKVIKVLNLIMLLIIINNYKKICDLWCDILTKLKYKKYFVIILSYLFNHHYIYQSVTDLINVIFLDISN